MPPNSPRATEYRVDPEMTRGDLQDLLSGCGRVVAGVPHAVARTLLDTFDGRLHQKGLALERRRDGVGERLELRRSRGRSLVARAAATDSPFVWDLEPGRLRARLEPILEMRALLPLGRVDGVVHPLEVRNRDDKLVLRASLEEQRAAPPECAEWVSLPRRLRLEPVRGYRKEMAKACTRVESATKLLAPLPTLLEAALQAIGRSPPTYSSKVRVALRPDQTAEAATRAILLQLLDTMRANEEGTRLALDTEFLHDFRVAVRRTRSALSQIKGVFPAPLLERYRAEFAWLGTVTGTARDLDVYLLSIPTYRSLLPGPLRADLDPLEALLRRLQRKEQRRVARTLRSRRYTKLVESWGQFLAGDELVTDSLPPDAARPIIALATQRLRKGYRRVMREGAAVHPGSPPEEFHELRKTCKKFRYLLEFFQSLYPPDTMKALIRALKLLQDNLGEYQDLSVQISSMRRFEEELGSGDANAGPTRRAVEVLVEAFHRRQQEVRAEFAARFAAFCAPETRALLGAALSPARRPGKGGAP